MKPLTDLESLSKQQGQQIDKVALFQERLLAYLNSDKEPSLKELEKKTGFDEVNLKDIRPRLRRFILAALAACEEAFHVNERLGRSEFYRVIQRINVSSKNAGIQVEGGLALKAGVPNPGASACAAPDCGIRFDACAINDVDQTSNTSAWNVNAGERMPFKLRFSLRTLIVFLHECGHQDESCLADRCFDELPPDRKKEMRKRLGLSNFENKLRKIDWSYKRDTAEFNRTFARNMKKESLESLIEDLAQNHDVFETFVCCKFMQYVMEKNEKEYGEKPAVGLIFRPGGKANSLSLYASTNPRDFYAELFAKVLLTHPKDLTRLGKTLRELLSCDHAAFRAWFRDGFTLDEYEAFEQYHAKHDGYEKCPILGRALTDQQRKEQILKSGGCLDKELEPFGFAGAIEDARFPLSFASAVQFKLTSNYNLAENAKKAAELQTKLANAVRVLVTLRKGDLKDPIVKRRFKKCLSWWEKQSRLLLMSEYCDCDDPDYPDQVSTNTANAYAWLAILDTLTEQDPKAFETPEACEKFLDAELAALDRDLKKAETSMDTEPMDPDYGKKRIDITNKDQPNVPVVPISDTLSTEMQMPEIRKTQMESPRTA